MQFMGGVQAHGKDAEAVGIGFLSREGIVKKWIKW